MIFDLFIKIFRPSFTNSRSSNSIFTSSDLLNPPENPNNNNDLFHLTLVLKKTILAADVNHRACND